MAKRNSRSSSTRSSRSPKSSSRSKKSSRSTRKSTSSRRSSRQESPIDTGMEVVKDIGQDMMDSIKSVLPKPLRKTTASRTRSRRAQAGALGGRRKAINRTARSVRSTVTGRGRTRRRRAA